MTDQYIRPGPAISAEEARLRSRIPAHRMPCRAHPVDLWFSNDPVQVERAKQLCHECPLQRRCLAGALQRHEPWGVWGGQLLEKGRIVARKRPPGRPRTIPVPA